MRDFRNYPRNWSILSLSEMGTFTKGKGITKADLVNEGLPCIRYGEIYTSHHHTVKKFHSFISHEMAGKSKRLNFNDLLFAGSGETLEEIGKAVGHRLSDEAYAGGDIVILNIPETYRADYIAYFLNSVERSQINKLGAGHSVVHIYGRDLGKVRIALPSKKIQDKIVSILQTWDTAIEKAEALTAAKERQFGWVVKRLLKSTESSSEKDKLFPLKKYMSETKDLHGKNKAIIATVGKRGICDRSEIYSKELSKDTSKNKLVYKDEIAFGLASDCIVYGVNLSQKTYSVSPAYKVFHISHCNSNFLRYLLDVNNRRLSLKYLITSARQGKSVDFQGFLGEKFVVPDLPEQQRIAQTLNTAKQEINLLNNLAEHYRRQKRGLMQKLLSGVWQIKNKEIA